MYRNDNNVHHKLRPGLPIIGHLHILVDQLHQDLHRLAQKYGPIMYIHLGIVPAIVVSYSVAAELFLRTHDLVFASQPKVQAAEICYGQRDIAFHKYGPQWRNITKECVSELLSLSKIESMKSTRKENINCLVRWVKDAAEVNVVEVSDMVGSLIEDMTIMMVVGCKEDGLEFKNCPSDTEYTWECLTC